MRLIGEENRRIESHFFLRCPITPPTPFSLPLVLYLTDPPSVPLLLSKPSIPASPRFQTSFPSSKLSSLSCSVSSSLSWLSSSLLPPVLKPRVCVWGIFWGLIVELCLKVRPHRWGSEMMEKEYSLAVEQARPRVAEEVEKLGRWLELQIWEVLEESEPHLARPSSVTILNQRQQFYWP